MEARVLHSLLGLQILDRIDEMQTLLSLVLCGLYVPWVTDGMKWFSMMWVIALLLRLLSLLFLILTLVLVVVAGCGLSYWQYKPSHHRRVG